MFDDFWTTRSISINFHHLISKSHKPVNAETLWNLMLWKSIHLCENTKNINQIILSIFYKKQYFPILF